MLFSCKITHSIASFLERRGEDLEELYDRVEVPGEFLKDPSYWLEADKMEAFLRDAEQTFGLAAGGSEPLLTSVGHRASDVRGWGALDSVLRMMQNSQDIYANPARFISYFVAPEPPVANLQRDGDQVCFDLPISSDQFPKVTEYLTSALESLPTYIGQPPAHAEWSGIKVRIQWSDRQANLLEGEATKRHLKPELVESIVRTLENSQKELEAKNQELALKNQELSAAQQRLQTHLQEQLYAEHLAGLSDLADVLGREIATPVDSVLSQIHRLRDYMVRAQQLITIMIGQDRLTAPVREAMRRTDWEFVKAEFPTVIHSAEDSLRALQRTVKELAQRLPHGAGEKLSQGDLTGSSAAAPASPPTPAVSEERVDADLNDLVTRAVDSVASSTKSGVMFDKRLFLDRPVRVFPARMEQALVCLLNAAVMDASRGASGPGAKDGKGGKGGEGGKNEKTGAVHIVTRPRGPRAEIEISEMGLKSDSPQDDAGPAGFRLNLARSIVKMHEGNFRVVRRNGEGSTFTIDLPFSPA